MKIKIANAEIQKLLSGNIEEYPKYATQIMNLANQNSQGTRSRIVGQMSDLIQEFEGSSIEEWERWYKERHEDSLDVATDKIYAMVAQLQKSIVNIDRDMVRRWVEELVVVKSYVGLKFQEAILHKIAAAKGTEYRLATPNEESQGIDGYIGNIAVSIKPESYRMKNGLNEEISIPIIFYTKSKSGITVEYDM